MNILNNDKFIFTSRCI